MEYIKRFRDIALDYYDHCEEIILVEMCMTNMIREFKAVLENSRNFLVCTAVVESQEDSPVRKTKLRQKKRPIGYGSVHWRTEKEN